MNSVTYENTEVFSSTKVATKALAWANVCRVVAIFGVILIHASGSIFYQYGKVSTLSWLSANLIDSVARCSVPLFVMLSGALLLKNKSNTVMSMESILRRVLKVTVPLLFWSYFYLKYVSWSSNEVVNFGSILHAPAMYHLWFVYMIVGLYLLLPVFQILYQGMKDHSSLQIYVMFLWLIINSVPIYFNLSILGVMNLQQFLGYGGYFLLGAFLVNSPQLKKVPNYYFLLLYSIGILATFILTWQYSFNAQAPVEKAYLYFSLNVFLSAFGGFMFFSKMNPSPSLDKVFIWLSDKCFLIYFVHVYALEKVRYNPYFIKISAYLPAFITIILSIIVFALCAAIAALIRLIVRNKYVFG